MKKYTLTSLLLLAAMLTASCGENTGTNTPVADTAADTAAIVTEAVTEAVPTEMDEHPLPDADMNGMPFRFLNYDPVTLTWALIDQVVDEETGESINDEIFRRNSRISEKYNVVFEETVNEDVPSIYRKTLMSGEDLYEIGMPYDSYTATLYSDGLIRSWDCLPHVDLERSWWDQNANHIFNIGGKQFAAVGDFYLGMLTRGFVIVFNKELLASADLNVNLYDMVRNSTWTLDKYIEIAKQFPRDLNGDGQWDEGDQYGTAGAIKLHFGSLAIGCGAKYFSYDKDGNPYFSVGEDAHTINVFEKIYELHDGTNIYFQHYKNTFHSGSNESRDMFLEGRTIFQGTSTKGIEYYRDSDFDIGILPYPKFDEKQEEYHILTSECGVATIPVTIPEERLANVSIILEALSRDGQQNLIPTYKEVVLKSKYSRDEDSAEMLDIIFKSSTYDLGMSIWPEQTHFKYMTDFQNWKNNFVSTTEKIEKVIGKQVDILLDAISENT